MAKSGYYTTTHWAKLRAQAIKRDGYKCQGCGALCTGQKRGGQRPYVDHKEPRPYAHTPTVYDVLDNLQTLCAACHTKKTKWSDASSKVEVGADGLPSDGSWG